MLTLDDRILAYIKWYIGGRGYPPSLREIAKAFALHSTSSVSYRLDKLESEGRIKVTPGVARGLKVLDGTDQGS